MIYEYTCQMQVEDEKTQIWNATMKILSHSETHLEVDIYARGTYFHLIAGSHKYGRYACIPNMDVGSEIADYKDLLWNRERLCQYMLPVDATTIAYALTHFPELIKKSNNV